MHKLLNHKLLVGILAVLVVGSAGGAYAATQSGSNPRQEFLNDVAKRLNVTPSQLSSAMQGALLDRLNAAVKAGWLTQAQADQIKQRIQQGGVPFGPGGPGFGFHRFGPGGGPGPGGPLGAGGPVHTAAQYLGISDTQLINDVRNGQTLAQIAQAQGKSVNGLEQALVAAAKTRLDKAVSSGALTQTQEQSILSRITSGIDSLVKQGHFNMGEGGGPPWGAGGPAGGTGGPPWGAGGPAGGSGGPPLGLGGGPAGAVGVPPGAPA